MCIFAANPTIAVQLIPTAQIGLFGYLLIFQICYIRFCVNPFLICFLFLLSL